MNQDIAWPTIKYDKPSRSTSGILRITGEYTWANYMYVFDAPIFPSADKGSHIVICDKSKVAIPKDTPISRPVKTNLNPNITYLHFASAEQAFNFIQKNLGKMTHHKCWLENGFICVQRMHRPGTCS